ncbi:ATP-binding protein [Nostoc muscorum FACHB-395]|nr:ATP-binding protein [Desmonostoc muscorum FACHB-395]
MLPISTVSTIIKTELFGDLISDFPPEHDSLELSFTPSSRPIKQRWRSNRLSAHFFADYFTNFLAVDENDPNQEKIIKESKSAVSYVANELLENAMKFNDDTSNYKVRFGIHLLNDADSVTAVIFASNSIKLEAEAKLRAVIEKVLTLNTHEMYVHQVEKSTEETGSSGLGLLTMINDYSAKIGWKLETIQQESIFMAVTTMAQFKV